MANCTLLRKISFSPPDITDAEIREVVSTLKSGWITTGPKTKLFEKKLASFVGASKAVCLNSATASMELTLRILGVGPGDEVITSPYTYTATASVIDHVGAKIVLVDVAPGSYEMDYSKLADAITAKTKVIIPVDIAGKMCDYDAIFDAVYSKKAMFKPINDHQKIFNRIIVLSDSAHGFGAMRKGLKSGQAADFTCFSFHAVKNLTTAEGGAIVWRSIEGLDDDAIYFEFQLLSNHGQTKDAFSRISGSWEYDIIYPAYKLNMNDIQASLGLIQLDRYQDLLQRRRKMIDDYNKAFLPMGVQVIKHNGIDFVSSGHLYLTRIPGITELQRNQVIQNLFDQGIACNVHFKPLPLLTAYKRLGFQITDYPNAYTQYQNEISIPLHTLLKDEDIHYIIENYQHIVKKVM